MDIQTRCFEIIQKLSELNVQTSTAQRNLIYYWVQQSEENTLEKFLSTILCPHCRSYLNLPGLPICIDILLEREFLL